MPFIDIESVKPLKILPGCRMRTPFGHNLMLSYLEMDQGAEVPRHEHPHEQGGMLLQGKMELTIGDETRIVEPGAMFIIPPNTPHRAVAVAGPVVVLDVFSPVREDYAELSNKYIPTSDDEPTTQWRRGVSSECYDVAFFDRWTYDQQAPNKPSPLLVGDSLYFVNDRGVAQCLDALTGKLLWRERLGGNFSASPLYGDGKIYFCSHEGVTSVVRASRDVALLASNHLAGRFMASPAVAGSALFLRTDTHLYRIEE